MKTTQVEVIKPKIPQSLTACENAPDHPGGDMTQRDVAKWAAALWFAHKDCQSKLDAVNRSLK